MIKKGTWRHWFLSSTYKIDGQVPAEISGCEALFRTYFFWMFWGLYAFMLGMACMAVAACVAFVFFDGYVMPRVEALGLCIMNAVRRLFHAIVPKCPLGAVQIER